MADEDRGSSAAQRRVVGWGRQTRNGPRRRLGDGSEPASQGSACLGVGRAGRPGTAWGRGRPPDSLSRTPDALAHVGLVGELASGQAREAGAAARRRRPPPDARSGCGRLGGGCGAGGGHTPSPGCAPHTEARAPPAAHALLCRRPPRLSFPSWETAPEPRSHALVRVPSAQSSGVARNYFAAPGGSLERPRVLTAAPRCPREPPRPLSGVTAVPPPPVSSRLSRSPSSHLPGPSS